ncbi:hypothetical protein BDW59DRAFT_160672 [Aspergillus cavernicola]|uniref:Retrovirus-related Pol polyprotein from transposon TNT 1-94-like beta-barrel domain-containing protein n=1 Tax=Aspergillus cavernicola TaxID=176166 RepID=A0ABR4IG98_9EURO
MTTMTTNPNPSTPQTQTRTWTWLLVPGTAHFAKNRSSFKTYHRAPGKIANKRVLGIGDVELKVRRGPDDDRMNTLVLRDVLHMPQARWNGLCVGKVREEGDEVAVDVEGDGDGDGDGEYLQAWSAGEEGGHGEALWYGEGYRGCSRVVLWGDPRGNESGFDDYDDKVGGVDVSGVDASAEELDTLHARVRERSLM